MFSPRRATARTKWSKSSARVERTKNRYSDYFHYRAWRYSNDRTGHEAGAVELLSKPFRDQDLLDAIEHATERDRLARRERRELERLDERYRSLTPREREVMQLVFAGLLNKQIAVELDLSEKTVNVHRGQVMHKMRADSLAELVRMAERLHLSPARREEH